MIVDSDVISGHLRYHSYTGSNDIINGQQTDINIWNKAATAYLKA
jgi:hypothetical protein